MWVSKTVTISSLLLQSTHVNVINYWHSTQQQAHTCNCMLFNTDFCSMAIYTSCLKNSPRFKFGALLGILHYKKLNIHFFVIKVRGQVSWLLQFPLPLIDPQCMTLEKGLCSACQCTLTLPICPNVKFLPKFPEILEILDKCYLETVVLYVLKIRMDTYVHDIRFTHTEDQGSMFSIFTYCYLIIPF